MGMYTHDAIICTCDLKEHAIEMRQRAIELGLCCTEVVTSPFNGFYSFLVAPDGSKDSRTDSDKYDKARRELLANPNGMWLHVRYSRDYDQATIVDSFLQRLESSKEEEEL